MRRADLNSHSVHTDLSLSLSLKVAVVLARTTDVYQHRVADLLTPFARSYKYLLFWTSNQLASFMCTSRGRHQQPAHSNNSFQRTRARTVDLLLECHIQGTYCTYVTSSKYEFGFQ